MLNKQVILDFPKSVSKTTTVMKENIAFGILCSEEVATLLLGLI